MLAILRIGQAWLVTGVLVLVYAPASRAEAVTAPASRAEAVTAPASATSKTLEKTSEAGNASQGSGRGEPVAEPRQGEVLPCSPSSPSWVAIALSFLSLCVSVVGAFLVIYKMQRDRRLSIEDDFWLRKIISPAAIEPLLKTVVDLLADVPSATASEDTQRAYASRVTADIQRLTGAMQTLAMLDPELPVTMLSKLSECEDHLTGYCQKLSEGELADVSELTASVWMAINSALRPVKTWQELR